MTTKDRILQQALALFNEHSCDQISSLQISQSLKISYGNLTYHFKNKEAIVLALYHQLQAEMNSEFSYLINLLYQRRFILADIRRFFEISWKYRFVYFNLSSLMVQFKEIRMAEKDNSKKRHDILNRLKGDLIAEGYIRQEEFIDYQYSLHSLSLLFHSWITDGHLVFGFNQTKAITYYCDLFINMMVPLLTPKGVTRFKELS